MNTPLHFLWLALLTLGSAYAQGAEPAAAIQPDSKTSSTISATENRVTLKIVCPKVVLANYGNYILMSVRNENDEPASFMEYAPDKLGIRYDIVPAEKQHYGWTTIHRPAFAHVIVNDGIQKDQEYKVLLYPARYKRLPPGHYKIRAYWEGYSASVPGKQIQVETKSVEFEYRED